MHEDEFRFASDYSPEYLERVHATCLYLALKLADLLEDIVVVGGLVPSLIVPQTPSDDFELHSGTADLDLGLAQAVLAEERYEAIARRLREAGFKPDKNDRGNLTVQRWRSVDFPQALVDFLIATSTMCCGTSVAGRRK